MITPLGWLERIPTYKEQLDQIKNKDLHTYGFLGYPTLQTADIVLYSPQTEPSSGEGVGVALRRPSLFVPVGEDQVSHAEFSRELVRRFNAFYGIKLEDDLREWDRTADLGAMYKALWKATVAPLEWGPPPDQYPLGGERWAEIDTKI